MRVTKKTTPEGGHCGCEDEGANGDQEKYEKLPPQVAVNVLALPPRGLGRSASKYLCANEQDAHHEHLKQQGAGNDG